MNEAFDQNKKKLILYVAIPVLCVLVIFAVFKSSGQGEEHGAAQSILNTQLPTRSDSTYHSKAEAYDAVNAQAAKDKEAASSYGVKNNLSFDLAKPATSSVDSSHTNQGISDAAAALAKENNSLANAKYKPSVQALQTTVDVDRQIDAIGVPSFSQSQKRIKGSGSHRVFPSPNSVVTTAASLQPDNGFRNISFETGNGSSGGAKSAIHGSVMRAVNLAAGEMVNIRTTESANINGVLIPKNTILSGITQTADDRLMITISGVQVNGEQTDINLSVYDQDGMEGIRAPSSAARSSAKQSLNDQVDNMDSQIMPTSGVGSAIASAGSGLLKAVRGTSKTHIPEGYRLILKIK